MNKLDTDLTEFDLEQLAREELSNANELKKRLRTAVAKDFDIVQIGEPYPYAASLYGCMDIAVFKRKADCERFIKTFKGKK